MGNEVWKKNQKQKWKTKNEKQKMNNKNWKQKIKNKNMKTKTWNYPKIEVLFSILQLNSISFCTKLKTNPE